MGLRGPIPWSHDRSSDGRSGFGTLGKPAASGAPVSDRSSPAWCNAAFARGPNCDSPAWRAHTLGGRWLAGALDEIGEVRNVPLLEPATGGHVVVSRPCVGDHAAQQLCGVVRILSSQR